MESGVASFLAFASVMLTANTLAIWFAYKVLSSVSLKVTDGMREFTRSSETRAFVQTLEIASRQVLAVSSVAKEQVQNLDPLLAHAQDVYGYGLAKVDRKFEQV